MVINGTKIYGKHIDIIEAVAMFGFLTTHLIQQLFFPLKPDEQLLTGQAREQALKKRLHVATVHCSALVKTGLATRNFMHPKGTNIRIHPTACLFLHPSNYKTLLQELKKAEQYSVWTTRFEHHAWEASQNHSTERSSLTLWHETDVASFFVNLYLACQRPDSPYDLVFFKPTSSQSASIQYKFTGAQAIEADLDGNETEAQNTLTFDVDGYYVLRHKATGTCDYWVLEYDRNTESLRKFRQKLHGFKTMEHQNLFGEIMRYFNDKYNLKLTLGDRVDFKVSIVAPDQKRRDLLLWDGYKLREKNKFRYTTKADTAPDKLFTKVGLRGREYEPIHAQERLEPRNRSPIAKHRWVYEQIKTMPRVSFLDA